GNGQERAAARDHLRLGDGVLRGGRIRHEAHPERDAGRDRQPRALDPGHAQRTVGARSTMSARKEWMLGIPGHNELVNLDAVLLLVRGGQLRPTDLVKKLGEPWRAANEVTELAP